MLLTLAVGENTKEILRKSLLNLLEYMLPNDTREQDRLGAYRTSS
jgi:hypothetical protein